MGGTVQCSKCFRGFKCVLLFIMYIFVVYMDSTAEDIQPRNPGIGRAHMYDGQSGG
jgi:hypothetical protein